MGVCTSQSASSPERQTSLAIDKSIQQDSKRSQKECKILLLGAGESGKSTVVKQMKIIHLNGYSQSMRLFFRPVVYNNLLESCQQVIEALEVLNLECKSEENKAHTRRIEAFKPDSTHDNSSFLDPSIAHSVRSFLKDPILPSILDQSHKFYLMDSAEYFFENVDRITEPDYVPNETDVLRARARTTGVSETQFALGALSIHMFDVGGQRSERRKWIHCFEAVTSIIFCTAMSEYDQVLLEESNQNRMTESLSLFESVVNSRWFASTSIILFLNKVDVFRRKLKKCPLEAYFPEYAGGADINKAAKFLLWKFQGLNRKPLMMYPHLTQATDTSNIRLVFAAVKETLLQNALRDSGIL